MDKSKRLRGLSKLTYIVLMVTLILTIFAGISIGPVSISLKDVWTVIYQQTLRLDIGSTIPTNTQNIVWLLRTPRVLIGVLIGINLSLSGVAMQSFTGNPLASPYILGTSAGAGFGAVLAFAFGTTLLRNSYSIAVFAFIGSIVAILLVYNLSRTGRDISPVKMILVGIAISSMFSAFTNFIVYKTPDQSIVRAVTFWMLGSLAGQEWGNIPVLLFAMVLGVSIMMLQTNGLNAILMGDASAITLGINTNRVRKLTIFSSAVMTGTSVAVAGSIGFVGLVVPHVVRALVGANHRKVIPMSIFIGPIFMVWVDIAARMVDAPSEMPIGIITSMIGAPFFLWLIHKRKYSFGK